MLKQRVITALILAPLAVWGIWSLDSGIFSIVLGAIFTLGAWEWSRLVGFEKPVARITYSAIFPLCFYLLTPLLQTGTWAQFVLALAAMWWTMALLSVITYPQSAGMWRDNAIARGIAGLLVLVPAWAALSLLHSQFGPAYFILLMLLIWGADIGAYFAGRAFGKRKLAPRVSPGKSWEGVIGGLLLALLVAALVSNFWFAPKGGLAAFLLLVVATVFVSVLGDLLESMFKRIMNLKDSGGILPGHGGILDRVDSLTAAAPLFTLGLLWLS